MYAICNVKFTGFCSERCLVRCRAKQGKKMTDCQPTHNNTSSVEGSCHSSEDDLKVQKTGTLIRLVLKSSVSDQQRNRSVYIVQATPSFTLRLVGAVVYLR